MGNSSENFHKKNNGAFDQVQSTKIEKFRSDYNEKTYHPYNKNSKKYSLGYAKEGPKSFIKKHTAPIHSKIHQSFIVGENEN